MVRIDGMFNVELTEKNVEGSRHGLISGTILEFALKN